MAGPTAAQTNPGQAPRYEMNDAHVHLTNYIQQGTDIHDFLKVMGDRVGRATLFGLPLQQQWSYGNTGDFAPTYYLQTDAPLYYYSFSDAWIAVAYKSLTSAEQARFDPMITGFNPADMYAADHIRRVLTTFPGVFSGIGEFSIHKEFVSAKIAGETASLTNSLRTRISAAMDRAEARMALRREPSAAAIAAAAALCSLSFAFRQTPPAERPSGKTFTNSIGMVLVRIPGLPGAGDSAGWVGRFEVTQEEYGKASVSSR